MVNNRLVDSKQFSVLIFVTFMSMKMFMIPALLIKDCARDGIFVMFAYLVVEFLIAGLIMLAMHRHPSMTFYEILEKAFGKVGSRVIVIAFTVYLGIKFMIMLSELKIFFTVNMNMSINWVLFLIPIMALFIMMAVKTVRDIARLAQVVFPFILLSTVLLAAIVLDGFDFSAILPLGTHKLGSLARQGVMHAMWGGDSLMFVILMGRTKIDNKFFRRSLLTGILASIAVMFFSYVIFANYSNISYLIDYGHNISNMVVYSAESYLYGRFDIPIFCIWIITVFVQLAGAFYIVVRNIKFVGGVNNNIIPSIAVAVVVILVKLLIFDNEFMMYDFCTGWMRWVAIGVQVAIPLIVLTVALTMPKEKHETHS